MFNTKLKQLHHGVLAALLAVMSTQSTWAQLPLPTVQATTPAPIQRAGVQADKQTLLTLREAVTMALENNREIEIERLNTQLSEQDLRAAKGFYDPTLSSSYFYDRQTTPVASILAGGENGKLRTTDFSGAAKLAQQLPWQGGNVNLSYDQSRTTSQNLFNALNPQFTSQLTVEFTQPLLRNRKIDAARRQLRIASKRLDLSDSQFRQRAIEIIAQAERAYWDLVFARRDADIKRESVALAQTQLEHNERLAKQGTLAPADVVSARVEVERRTDEAEAAIEAIQRAENALKLLLLPAGATEQWSAALVPAEQPQINHDAALPVEDALRLAFANRPEMEQYRLRGELNKVDVAYFKNQTKPQIDFFASYGTYGLAGKERTETNPIVAGNQLLFDRVNQLSQVAGLAPLPPFSFGATPEKFIGGYGQNAANLFRNEYRAFRAGVTFNLSLRNRTAKANYGRALVEGKQLDAQRQRTEQQIEGEVRNAVQGIETAKRRVEAAKNSRVNAELQAQSEQRKFDAGQSTNFFVLDRQNALSSARGRELKALTDYTKAVAEMQRALSTTLTNNNVALVSRR
ncbi:MAG: TolC family protein [Acidobacteria bacterium]|nr:TolC family protein [Acidobacteriota bacterium]MBI3423737.1 TolC family protein [Acidobacteriota bacterium]